jgi:cytochrome c oxidase cbb3-type subunit 3
MTSWLASTFVVSTAALAIGLMAQGQAPNPESFPAQQRPPADPGLVERGRALYGVSCSACHGADARGGQLGGPNLLRSQLVLNDQQGELIAPIVRDGRPGTTMVPISMSTEDVGAIAAFLHALQAAGAGQGSPPPGPPVEVNVLVGDARAGAAYFERTCSQCHSAAGDLQGIATRIPDARTLQNSWVAGRGAGRGGGGAVGGRGGPPITVTITPRSGEPIEGRLVRIDDFLVTAALADGSIRSFPRTGSQQRIDIRDPLEAHRALLPVYTNQDMRDVTAFLATLQ